MKATILGVGTELTTGQIVNKNGAAISEKLLPFGVITTAHLVVPDDRKLILDTLEFAAANSDLIFVTGGLGPTSDDFTRDLISEWAKKALIFDEISWQHVQQRLTSRGFTVKDLQRQQCYFPETAKILKNSNGTANGFQITVQTAHGPKEVFALPGPPREIDAIWADSIQHWLAENTQHIDKKITKSWDTMGQGESDVAVTVEDIIKQFGAGLDLKNNIEIGYRVHLPYVEVKITYVQSIESKVQTIVQKINQALNPITVLRDFENITDVLAQKTAAVDFAFYDFVSGGFLHTRLSGYLKKYKNWMWKQSQRPLDTDFFNEEENFLALFPQDDKHEKAVVIGHFNNKRFSLSLEAPANYSLMPERRQQYFAEMAMIEFAKRLT